MGNVTRSHVAAIRRSTWFFVMVLLWMPRPSDAQPSYNIIWNSPDVGCSTPTGLMQARDGKLYGVCTDYAGTSITGAVFVLDPVADTVTTLHAFTGGSDGKRPYGPLIQATDGKLYGTASEGGANGYGTIFSLDPAIGGISFEVLYTFPAPGGPDGWQPLAGLIQGPDGRLYGTANGGGAYQGYFIPYGTNAGTVFALDPVTRAFSTVHSFGGGVDGLSPGSGSDGLHPLAPLVLGSDGKLYGTTYYDGVGIGLNSGLGGTVFSVDPATGTFQVLHTFTATPPNYWDGINPIAGLMQARDGKLYGTTWRGGIFCQGNPNCGGYGTVFRVDPTVNPATGNNFAVVYTFTAGTLGTAWDGAGPQTPLVQASDGKLYGMTADDPLGVGKGTLFSLDPANNYTFALVHTFLGAPTDGDVNIYSGLMRASDGTLYGMTSGGGASNIGVIFRVTGLVPTITLKVNGQHPSPPIVTTAGQMTLTLDMSASVYTAPLSWYWALIVNGQVLWVTSTGLKTTPAPLLVGPPVAIANATLLNVTLPPATTVAALFFVLDGSNSVIAADLIVATRP
jgi:uncharacterized repeat protein (TIGR03803 family)